VISQEDAMKLVGIELSKKSGPDDTWLIVEGETVERSFGWVFFYNTKEFIETGNPISQLAGNGPVIFDRRSGRMQFFGSGRLDSTTKVIDDYEREWLAQGE
jgi:hypothetical protein